MALGIEGANHNIFSGTNTGTVNVTTAGTNRILVVSVHNEKNGSRQTVSSVTSAGLTWTRRKAFAFNASNTALQNLETWWAYAPSQLTAHTITVTLSAATDDATIGVFAVSGANVVSPWDSNAAIPATNSDITGANSTGSVPGVSTTTPDCVLLGFWGAGGTASSTPTVGTGYTQINSFSNGGGTNFSIQFTEYKIVSAAQSGVTIPTAVATQKNWGMIGDAIQIASTDVSGVLSTTEAADGAAFTGALAYTGSLATTEGQDVAAAAGYLPATGTLITSEANDVMALTGPAFATGTFAITEPPDIVAAFADRFYGSFALTEAADVGSFQGFGRRRRPPLAIVSNN